jgi:hypothetical protein
MPMVFPNASRPVNSLRLRSVPARRARSVSVKRLIKDSIMPTTCSATASALPPDWLTTSMPRSVQALMSTVS